MTRAREISWGGLPILLMVFLCAGPLAAQETSLYAYSYFTTVEGDGTLFQSGSDTRTPIEVNLPIVEGDRLWLAPGARLAATLSDGTRLRLDGDSEAILHRIAFSPDSQAAATQIELVRGRLSVALPEGSVTEESHRLDTGNGTVYLHDAGEYLISTNGVDWTEVIVRSGYAELLTERGSIVVRAGESVLVEGQSWPVTRLAAAPAEGDFELWVRRDEELHLAAATSYLEEPLQSSAYGLAEHGEWVETTGGSAWRPHAGGGWQPYYNGRWTYTPGGLYWVSYDPWSPVTYHYGSWNWDFHFGWVWYPGYAYAPAHVYWYWGPSFVGWIPSGYYHHYYGPRFGFGFSFHFGTYGWAGGHWGHYDRWVFCRPHYLGHHRQPYHHKNNSHVKQTLTSSEMPRGILANDTRGLEPDLWTKTESVQRVLVSEKRLPSTAGGKGHLADMTPFVSRTKDLPPDLQRQLLVPDKGGSPSPAAKGLAGAKRAPADAITSTARKTKPSLSSSPPTSALAGRPPGAGKDPKSAIRSLPAQAKTNVGGAVPSARSDSPGKSLTTPRARSIPPPRTGVGQAKPTSRKPQSLSSATSTGRQIPRSLGAEKGTTRTLPPATSRPVRSLVPSAKSLPSAKRSASPKSSLAPTSRTPTRIGVAPSKSKPTASGSNSARRVLEPIRSRATKPAVPAAGERRMKSSPISRPPSVRKQPITSRPVTSRPTPSRPTVSKPIKSRPTVAKPNSVSRPSSRSSGIGSRKPSSGVRSQPSRPSPGRTSVGRSGGGSAASRTKAVSRSPAKSSSGAKPARRSSGNR